MWSSAIEARLRFFCPYPAEKACPLRPWLLACLIIRIKLIIALHEHDFRKIHAISDLFQELQQSQR